MLRITGPNAQQILLLRRDPATIQTQADLEQALLDAYQSVIDAVSRSASKNPSLWQGVDASAVSAWTIDATHGDDNSPSINGAVLRTAGELCRRWGSGPITVPLVTVTQHGDLASGDGYYIENLKSGAQFPIPQVVVNVLPSSTRDLPPLTDSTPIDHTQPSDCAQYVKIAGRGWAEVDELLRVKSGPRAGITAWGDTDVGGGKFRTSPFVPYTPGNNTFFVTPISPIAGDVLTAVTPGKCHNLNIFNTSVSFQFVNAWFDDESGNGHNLEYVGDACQFFGCRFGGFHFQSFALSPGYLGCHFDGNCYTAMAQAFAHACHFIGGAYAFEGTGDIGGDTLLRSSRIFLIGPAGGANHMDAIGAVGAYGAGAGAVIGGAQGAQIYLGNYGSGEACILYGTADYNVDVHTNSVAIYAPSSLFKVNPAIAKWLVSSGASNAALPISIDPHNNGILAA